MNDIQNNLTENKAESDEEKEVISPFASEELSERQMLLSQHTAWLDTLKHEFPDPRVQYRVAVYIRFFNSTRNPNFLEHTKAHYEFLISQCPKWTLVGFYVDMGASVPQLEHSKQFCEMIDDCDAGKIDLIITKRVNQISKNPFELSLLCKYLIDREHPVGIYFESEDIFTTASYYMEDIRDTKMLPEGWKVLSDIIEENGGELGEQERIKLING